VVKIGLVYLARADTGKRVTPTRYVVGGGGRGTPGEIVRWPPIIGGKLQEAYNSTLKPNAYLRRREDGTYIIVNEKYNVYSHLLSEGGKRVKYIPEIEWRIPWWLIALVGGSGAIAGYLMGRRGKKKE